MVNEAKYEYPPHAHLVNIIDTETAERSLERKWPVTEYELQQEDAENDEGNRNGESEVKSVAPAPVSKPATAAVKSETPK